VVGRRRRKISTLFDTRSYGYRTVDGRGRRSFEVRLHPLYPRRVHFIVLTATAEDPPQAEKRVVAHVSQ
jgi:hypothetical protein